MALFLALFCALPVACALALVVALIFAFVAHFLVALLVFAFVFTVTLLCVLGSFVLHGMKHHRHFVVMQDTRANSYRVNAPIRELFQVIVC